MQRNDITQIIKSKLLEHQICVLTVFEHVEDQWNFHKF